MIRQVIRPLISSHCHSQQAILHRSRPLSTLPNLDLLCHNFEVDESYFRNEANQKRILRDIQLRDVAEDYPQLFRDNLSAEELSAELIAAAKHLPNSIHPIWTERECDLTVVEEVGQPKKYNFAPQRAEAILFNLGLAHFADMKTGKLGIVGGRRSYAFSGKLAKLSRALSRWTMRKLVRQFNFTPVVIPNLINADIIRACGFEPHGDRTQVYSFEGSLNTCLAGTGEMPLASLHIGENFQTSDELPKRYCALSRCYRAEANTAGEMSGLYRVHYFDKVEMFGFAESTSEASDRLLEEFTSIQRSLFSELGLHFRIVDMPPHELGAPAHRKFDMEAYMPGRDYWGEISSASNCTAFQSKRLNITYNKFYFDEANVDIVDVRKNHVHTVNGTACAVPRIIISIVEQNQTADGQVILPEVLRPLMGCDTLNKEETV